MMKILSVIFGGIALAVILLSVIWIIKEFVEILYREGP